MTTVEVESPGDGVATTAMPSMSSMPTGTVTFLFTDIEGSTRRWEQHTAAMQAALERHDALLREAIEGNGGRVFKTVGDAFCAAFASAGDALAAALASQRAVVAEDWSAFDQEFPPIRVRIGLHTGAAQEREGDYFGPPVNRAARIEAAGHGGQTLLSAATWELVRDSLPPDIALHDVGLHRLKDLTQPERIFQVAAPGLELDFPPLRSLDARRHNLPVQRDALIGRQAELVGLRDLLTVQNVALVTLTGTGGTGKTRLALHVGAEISDAFPDGVWLVELAAITDPELVAPTIAAALALREQSGEPILDTLKRHLLGKNVLLVLDNLEQVLGAAPIVASLLAATPGLRVLATSRSPLRIRGEREFPLAPLAIPRSDDVARADAATLADFDALRLFAARAAAVRPGFEVTPDNAASVAEICRRLDGLPLAIELAAARVRVLHPADLLKRLANRLDLLTGGARDLPDRQQSLRAAIAWSYDLLSPAEQRLFTRLGVFHGGWTLGAAEAVCGAARLADDPTVLPGRHPLPDPPALVELGGDQLDLLAGLVEASLVHTSGDAGEPRYTMLETIREFAVGALAQSDEVDAVRERHCRCFLLLVERYERRRRGQFGSDAERAASWMAIPFDHWYTQIEQEPDNLRAAVEWGARGGSADLHGRLVLSQVFTVSRHIRSAERVAWMERVVNDAPQIDSEHVRGEVLYTAGAHLASVPMMEEAVRILERTGDSKQLGWALQDLGALLSFVHDRKEEGRRYMERALAVKRLRGNKADIAISLILLGGIARAEGDLDAEEEHNRSARVYFESDTTFLAGRDVDWYVHVLVNLGSVTLRRGDLVAAREAIHSALTFDIGSMPPHRPQAEALARAAALSRAGGAPRRAALLFGAARGLLDRAEEQLEGVDQADYDRDAAATLAELGDAAYAAAWTAGRSLTFADAVAQALSILGAPDSD